MAKKKKAEVEPTVSKILSTEDKNAILEFNEAKNAPIEEPVEIVEPKFEPKNFEKLDQPTTKSSEEPIIPVKTDLLKSDPLIQTDPLNIVRKDPPKVTTDNIKSDVVLTLGKENIVKSTIEDKFSPSNTGWYTTSNDTKKRFSAGVFLNSQIGKHGTIRVDENGTVQYIKHTDFAKTTKNLMGVIDTFVIIKRNEKEILQKVNVVVKLS